MFRIFRHQELSRKEIVAKLAKIAVAQHAAKIAKAADEEKSTSSELNSSETTPVERKEGKRS